MTLPHRSHDKYVEALEFVCNGISLHDSEGRIQWCNSLFAEMIGVQRADVIGKAPDELEGLAPQTAAGFFQRPLSLSENSSRIFRNDTTGKWLSATTSGRMKNDEGEDYLLTVVRDITSKKRTEDLLRSSIREARGKAQKYAEALELQEKLNEELKVLHKASEDAHKARDAFLANISHEIRTPLNGIIGLTSLLRETSLSKEQDWHTDMILKSSESLLSMIDNILDYSRMESGVIRSGKREFNIESALFDSLSTIAVRAFTKGLEFSINIAPDIPSSLFGETEHLVRVLSNLTENAMRFTEHGFVSVECSLKQKTRDEAMILFKVKDSGKGIAKEHLSKIFERFTQEDNSITRKYGGTGLGLAICRQLVQFMGGTIHAESSPEGGAQFVFTARFGIVDDSTWTPGIDLPEDTNVLVVAGDKSANALVVTCMLAHWGIPFKSGHNIMAIERAAKRFNTLVVSGDLLEDKNTEFYTILTSNFEADRIVAMATPSQYLTWRQDKHLQGTQLLPMPISASMLAAALHGHEIISEIPSEAKRHAHIDSPTPQSPPRKNGIRVLVAEDNEINQIFAKKTLERSGYTVSIACDGLEALELYQSDQKFDLILMDIQMPELDGVETTRTIRQLENGTNNRIPIVALTAGTPTRNWDECEKAGMDGFISKPISAGALQERIAKYLHTDTASKNSHRKPNDSHFETALAAVGGDKELFAELLGIVMARWPELMKQVETDYDNNDMANLAKTLHTVKGSINSFGSPDFVPTITRFMESARNDNPVPKEECTAYLQKQWEVLQQLKTVCASAPG